MSRPRIYTSIIAVQLSDDLIVQEGSDIHGKPENIRRLYALQGATISLAGKDFIGSLETPEQSAITILALEPSTSRLIQASGEVQSYVNQFATPHGQGTSHVSR